MKQSLNRCLCTFCPYVAILDSSAWWISRRKLMDQAEKMCLKFTVTLAVVFIIFPCVSSASPTGVCLNGLYKFCEWANWLSWSGCSNLCGTGIRTRTKMICCPKDIKESNISKCVVDLCKFSMAQYWENTTCTSTKNCPTGRYCCMITVQISPTSKIYTIIIRL